MATSPFAGGGGGGGGGSPTGSPGSLQLPPLYGGQEDILSMLLGKGGALQRQPNIAEFLQQGMQSPLLEAVLGPALARYMEGADQSRQALTDRYRASGGLRSGAYSVAGPKLEGEILQGRGSLIGDVISKMLSPMLQAQLGAYSAQVDPLTRLFSGFPQPSRVPYPPGGGGGGGMGSSSDPWSRLSSLGAGGAGGAGGGYGGYLGGDQSSMYSPGGQDYYSPYSPSGLEDIYTSPSWEYPGAWDYTGYNDPWAGVDIFE